MAVPHWVRDLPGYWDWLDRLVIESGAYLDLPALVVEPLVGPDGVTWTGLVVETQQLHFQDGSILSFHVVLTGDFQLDSYSFHYQYEGGPLIWRKDNSPGHDELGQLEHIHRESEEKDPEPFPEVDLEEALDEVHRWQTNQEMP